MCQEASDLSSLKPLLDERGVALFAVVKENIASEIHDFRAYFNGEIFLDQQRAFYGPQERWMGVSGILRAGVWMSGWRAYQSGFWGNVRGEGFVLGALYVIGPGQQGVLLEHREMEFGDKVKKSDVIQAVEQINTDIKKA
uniref:Peroxiredoxin-like 2A n=1 Tax=Sinocyclocheilus anshuiensis TaxID=1608454 RepID=A0A671QFQ9_9TELE